MFGVTFLFFSLKSLSRSWADFRVIDTIVEKVPFTARVLSVLMRYLNPLSRVCSLPA